MSYSLVETLKQMGVAIRRTYLKKTGKVDYNNLRNRPIIYDSTLNEDVLHETYSKINSLTPETWDPVNNDYYINTSETKYVEGSTISEADHRTRLEVPCEIDDDIFVTVCWYEPQSYLGPVGSDWTLIAEGSKNLTDTYDYWTYYKIYHKKAETAPELFTVNNSQLPRSYSVQAIAITGVESFTVDQRKNNSINDYVELNTDGNASLINFTHSTTTKRNITFPNNTEIVTYHSSTNRNAMFFTTQQERLYKAQNSSWGWGGESARYVTKYPDITVITLEGVASMDAISGTVGAYVLVDPTESYDSSKNYYQKSKMTYGGSEIATKADIPSAGQIQSGDTGYATGGNVYTAIGNVESALSTINTALEDLIGGE